MLLTEENGVIELLPALPKNFGESGEVKNMVANSSKISFKWKNGLVTEVYSDRPISVLNKHIAPSAKIGGTVTLKELEEYEEK